MTERCADDRPNCPDDRPHEDIPLGGADLGDGLSGFVIVRLSRDLGPGEGTDLRELCDELDMDALARLLDALGRPPTRRVVTSLSPGEILRLEDEAQRSPWRPEHSLSRYWRIDARALPDGLDELAARLARLPEVESAYPEMVVSDPVVNAANDPLNAQQGYLDAAPTGIDARWAWTQANGEGQAIGFVDLEQGWRLGHEDYATKAPTLLSGSNRDGVGTYVGHHGTAVLGEVVADDNTLGVVGIAPSVASARVTSHFDGTTALHVADAIAGALPSMAAGDVLLLEVQRAASPLPTETDDADHAAIRLASARGVIVVEAAGNGGNDLDAWTDAAGRFRLRRGHPDFRDTGAIMVGAASSTMTNQRHSRLGFSNFGARVDCYGWGENVTTCGYGDLSPMAGLDAAYTAVFGGTSSASPIVAGAAIVTQSLYRGATGGRLSPGQMRGILANPANGTGQAPTPAGNIGVMPNLRQIGQNVLGLVPDVYLRDAAGDTGVVPSGGALSTSPDVILRPVAVANPVAAFGEGSGTANDESLGFVAEAGQDNVIYVRMRNRGAAAANGVRATVYWSAVSTLVTPATWNLIGTTAPVNVPTGNTLAVAPGLTWPAAQIPATGHYCFVAVLDHPQDPAPPIPGPTDWTGFLNMIRNTNNVTWRNFNVQDVQPDPGADPVVLPFLLAGAPDEARRFDLEIAVHLPEDIELTLELPPAAAVALPGAWRELLRPGERDDLALDVPRLRGSALCGVRLHAGAAHACRFILAPGKGLARGTHTVAVRQFFEGLEVGRVTWALRPAKRSRRRKG